MRCSHTFHISRFLVVIAMLTMLLPSWAGADDRPRLVFLSPGSVDDVFFKPMTDFMRAAADDLGFDMEVFYGDRNHVLIDDNVRAVFNRANLPEYVVGMNARGSGETLLKLAEKSGVKTVFINQSFLGEERERVGYPGEKYTFWQFEYLPDDVHAGYILARALIARAYTLGLSDEDGVIHVVAISGHETSPAALLREEGLQQAVSETRNVRLEQVVHAGWRRDRARELVKGLLDRHPKSTVIWSASDKMAMGICEGVRELGKVPGEDVLTGGVDWASIALGMVESGDFTVTVGGHFMDGAWALVMLYDQIHGHDMPRPIRSHFSTITANNIKSYRKHFGSGNWAKIDFTRFSKHFNPQLERYDFGLNAILRQVVRKR